jgi:hypothetical protein
MLLQGHGTRPLLLRIRAVLLCIDNTIVHAACGIAADG